MAHGHGGLRPVVDGSLVTEDLWDSVQSGATADVAMLVGTCSDEVGPQTGPQEGPASFVGCKDRSIDVAVAALKSCRRSL